MNQPKRLENARILIANTAMDTDKIKVFGSKVSRSRQNDTHQGLIQEGGGRIRRSTDNYMYHTKIWGVWCMLPQEKFLSDIDLEQLLVASETTFTCYENT